MKLTISNEAILGTKPDKPYDSVAIAVAKLVEGQRIIPAVSISATNAKGVTLDTATVCLDEKTGKLTLVRETGENLEIAADTLTEKPRKGSRKKKKKDLLT